MMKSLFIFLIFFSSQGLWAEIDLSTINKENVVIDSTYVQSVQWEEPSFPSRRAERDLAQMPAEAPEGEWQGQLAVLKEIPYSYPQLNDRILQLRILGEMEGNKKPVNITPEEEAYTTE